MRQAEVRGAAEAIEARATAEAMVKAGVEDAVAADEDQGTTGVHLNLQVERPTFPERTL